MAIHNNFLISIKYCVIITITLHLSYQSKEPKIKTFGSFIVRNDLFILTRGEATPLDMKPVIAPQPPVMIFASGPAPAPDDSLLCRPERALPARLLHRTIPRYPPAPASGGRSAVIYQGSSEWHFPTQTTQTAFQDLIPGRSTSSWSRSPRRQN